MQHEPITPPTPPTPDLNDTAAAWGARPSLRKLLFAIVIVVIFIAAMRLLR